MTEWNTLTAEKAREVVAKDKLAVELQEMTERKLQVEEDLATVEEAKRKIEEAKRKVEEEKQKVEEKRATLESTLRTREEELKASRDHNVLVEKSKKAAETNIKVQKSVAVVRERLLKAREAQLDTAQEGTRELSGAISSLETDLNILIEQTETNAQEHVASIGDTYESVIAAELSTKENLEKTLQVVLASQEATRARPTRKATVTT